MCFIIFFISCNDQNEFNPQNLTNDEIVPPLSNRLDYVEFEKYDQYILTNRIKVKFEEDTVTKKLWSKLIVSNNANGLLIYEPEYINGRLIKLIDRTGSNQNIEIEYYYDVKTQKHLISKLRYFKITNPYSLTFNYVDAKLAHISIYEIDNKTRLEKSMAIESKKVCVNADSCSNSEIQYQFTSENNPFYFSNEMFPVLICMSDFQDEYQGKINGIARFLVLYAYNKLPYSYQLSKYNHTIDYQKNRLEALNFKIINQNPLSVIAYNMYLEYRY